MKALSSYFFLTVLCLLLYLPGISVVPIIDRDSPHFAQASRQMLETNNYFQIRFQEKPRHLKPPGIYWLQSTSARIFSSAQSNDVWPYRLPSALGGLLAVLLLFYFAKDIYTEKIALLGASFLASSLLLVIESHLCVTDAPFLASIVAMQGAAWKIYIDHHQNRQSHWGLPVVFWLAMSLGILIKGISPLFALLTVGTLCVVDRDVSWLKKLKLPLGFLLLVISCVWLVPLSLASNSNFLLDMVKGDVLPKLVGGQQSHGMPPGYFFIIFSFMFWPASLFIWRANVFAWQRRKFSVERFLIAWVIPAWIFFAIVPTKLPEYVLPLYPAIAILTAKAVLDVKEYVLKGFPLIFNRIQYVVWSIVGVVFITMFVFVPYYLNGSISNLGIGMAALTLLLMLTVFWSIWKRELFNTAIISIVGSVVLFGLIFQFFLPSLKPLWISEKVAVSIEEVAPNVVSVKRPLISIGYNEPSLVFLMGTRKVEFLPEKKAMEQLVSPGAYVIIVSQKSLGSFLTGAKAKDLDVKRLKEISGYNYSRGRWITLFLYGKSG